MRTNNRINVAIIIIMTALSGVMITSCSNEEATPTVESQSVEHVAYVATLSQEQQVLLASTGSPYGEIPQKDAWLSIIAPSISACWGVFDDPRISASTRAMGIWGSYPAQYWTMLRVKMLKLPMKIKDGAILAIDEIEEQTNVRFYNSIEDQEFFEPYHIKLPNIAVRMDAGREGSGSYGLVGGEQYINVPTWLENADANEIKRFFLHAFCNAAGMFNEQQRPDRDNYVKIYLENVKDNCKSAFDKIKSNYTTMGNFDTSSITLASSKDFSKNGSNTITTKTGLDIAINYTLSTQDKLFLNSHYLPYIARKDNYTELDKNVYNQYGKLLTEEERLQLQNQINSQRGLYGEPPVEGRLTRVAW